MISFHLVAWPFIAELRDSVGRRRPGSWLMRERRDIRASYGLVFHKFGPVDGILADDSCLFRIGWQGGRGNEGPLIALLSEAIHHVHRRRLVILQVRRVELGPVMIRQHRINEQPPFDRVLPVDHFGGLVAVPPEAAGDQEEQARAEEEAALALQARLAQHALEGTIGHAKTGAGGQRPGVSVRT